MLLALPAVTKPVDRRAVTVPASEARAEAAPAERRSLAHRVSTALGVTRERRPAIGGTASERIALRVPVDGFTIADLRDNFTQPRSGGRMHGALDIMAPRGTPVVAAVDGTIRKLFNSRAGGISVYQFDKAEQHVYYYAHLDRYADDIAEGLFVQQGRVLGYVGTTGNAAPDAPHLHFAIEQLTPEKLWWKGTPLNPYTLLTTPASTLP